MKELVLTASAAEELILSALKPLPGWEWVHPGQALGRVLAEDLRTVRPLPPHDNAAMDGYAVRGADLSATTPCRLQLVGHCYAGHPFHAALQGGETVRIMTGAPLPSGADTVVMQEAVRIDGNHIIIPPGEQAGQHVRHAGEDLAAGSVALAAGRRCTSSDLGLIAALGMTAVKLKRRLRIALFSSGDELADTGTMLAPGQIYDSNRHSLAASLRQLGCEVFDLGIIPDQAAALDATLENASASADVILSSGGIAVGAADHMRDILADRGRISFLRLAIKPGQRIAFGHLGNSVLFGLPGNPAAAQVVLQQFVRPALLKLMGVHPLPAPLRFLVRADFSLVKRPGRREFVRGQLQNHAGTLGVQPAGAQGSGMLHSLAAADCLIILDEDSTGVERDDLVMIQPFNELP